MKNRHLIQQVHVALKDTPVVLIAGARQVGKSTLAQMLVTKKFSPRYVTLDNPTVFAAAKSDPTGFLDELGTPAIIDEVQKIPQLFPVVKYRVDQARKPGMYLLTGSANVLVIPKVSESLAGRMELITLWPFSHDEIDNMQKSTFVDKVFRSSFKPSSKNISRKEIANMLLIGGYPSVVQRTAKERRSAWFESYITSLVQRDLRDLSQLDHVHLMPKLFELFAARSGTLMNFAEISRSVGIPETTLKRYTTLLEAVYLIIPIQAYSGNLSKRVIRTPKMFLNDTGLMCALLNITDTKSGLFVQMFGHLLETFVLMELIKQSGWSKIPFRIYHYRSHSGVEVDFVLESAHGIVGIEVKAASQVESKHFFGLRSLEESIGKKFIRGFVLYTGTDIVPFAKNLYAVPIGTMW